MPTLETLRSLNRARIAYNEAAKLAAATNHPAASRWLTEARINLRAAYAAAR